MEMLTGLQGQMRQSLELSPQVIQSIKLLNFGYEDLLSFLKDQEERNPFIEVVMNEGGLAPNREAMSPDLAGTGSPHERESAKPLLSSSAYSGGAGRMTGSQGIASGDLPNIEEIYASSISLQQHVLSQIDLNIKSSEDRVIAREIVASLEPDGYLLRELSDIADELDVALSCVEQVLELVHTFEPTGIAARNLSECLRLQLAEMNKLTPAMSTLLQHLDKLGAWDVDALAKVCGVGPSVVATMVATILNLDPRPGWTFDEDPALPALPDVHLDIRNDGTFHIEMNASLLPKVLIDKDYYVEMKAATKDDDNISFVSNCFQNANWLTRNLDRRTSTILKVATEIVKRQMDFFRFGQEHIKPLNQCEVAEALGIHASTVCRATAGKYILTDRGMFELKYFFTNALQSSAGEEGLSTEFIRTKIRSLVNEETAKKILSDEAIAQVLQSDGIDIARRTVAKYREMMNIPSSQIRRRLKRVSQLEKQACVA